MSKIFKPLNKREEEEIIDYYYNPNVECTCNAIFADTHRAWCHRRHRPQEVFYGRGNIQQTEDGHSKAKSSIPSGDISSVVSSSENRAGIYDEEDFVLSKKIKHYGSPRNWIEKEDIQKLLKLVKQDVDKNKLLEADFQSGEIEFSLTGELIPIEILNNIIKLRAGEELIQDG